MTPHSATGEASQYPRRRRHDPQRRDRIIDACLDVIAEHGVAGTSHRRIAAAAGVPLGSMTYHFTGMDELLREAFTRFSQSVIGAVDERISEARTHELCTLAARDPAYRRLTNAWMRSSRAALEKHLDPATARMVDALIEGLTIHRALDTEPQQPGLVREAVRRMLREG